MSDTPPSLPDLMTGKTLPGIGIRIRSRLFKMMFPVWTTISCTSCLPLLVYKDSYKIRYAGDLWGRGTIRLLKIICNVNYEVRGEEHVKNCSGRIVFVCNHQSIWETAAFLALYEHPAYIFKKELLRVPLFGTFLKALEMISIDRSAGASALKYMARMSTVRLEQNRHLVIFPEGTRAAPGENLPFQPGAAMLYRQLPDNVQMIPVAVNSAAHWSARRKTILPGKIILEYGKPLPSGLDKKTLMTTLEADINSRRDALMAESAATFVSPDR